MRSPLEPYSLSPPALVSFRTHVKLGFAADAVDSVRLDSDDHRRSDHGFAIFDVLLLAVLAVIYRPLLFSSLDEQVARQKACPSAS